MLFLVREVYDFVVYFISEEYKERYGGKGVDVQLIIEVFYLYMLGALGVKDFDQLVFVFIRRECLKELQVIEVFGLGEIVFLVMVIEKMRFMNGDNLFVEFEDGIQKGGYFDCFGCGGDMRRVYEYDYMVYQKYRIFEEK